GQSRLGDAIVRALSERTRGNPLAGAVVWTDGQSNGGLDPLDAARRAETLHAPLFLVGLGANEPRRNLRVQELIAPSRGYPDDRVAVRVIVSGEGVPGESATVELYAAKMTGGVAEAKTRLGTETVLLPADGSAVAAQFEIVPSEIGRLELEAVVSGARNEVYDSDNRRTAEVEIVENSLRVLIIAGGASRDYRFLRNQLRRDAHVDVDVLLQLSPPGAAQDANEVLENFPEDREQMFEYDAVVGFDPDWTRLDAQQVDLLEKWVAEEGGGLFVAAGPVHTPAWVQSPEHIKIRALYPVEFQRRLTLLDDGLYGSLTPWRIEFTRAGEEAEFLWLKPSPEENREQWEAFPGVYGCYAVKGEKPGAVVLGRFGDPDAGLAVERPVYLAEQFYGAGRVFYMGSSELWRLRGVSPTLFETLTTQILRHVSEGRLLRGSSRGRLMVERDRYGVGETVIVRAQLTTLRHEPYVAPQATARLTSPDGVGSNLALSADAQRPGSFVGQFTVLQPGSYRIELPIPETLDEQLSRRIQVSAPDREYAETRRNDELLEGTARLSGGRYYTDWQSALEGGPDSEPLASLLPSQAETRTIEGEPDAPFGERLRKWLLAAIVGGLCLEWTGRRLLKLA
ncbi:MAG: VWA domain-containing protein, partial [Planctomycetales bacterium]|nr:VWA domain-containing protein [Planctomycetales bacterium]